MGGKSKTTTNSTQNLAAYDPAKPVIDQGVNIMSGYLNNPRSTAVYQGPRVADMSRDTRDALGAMRGSRGANDAYGFFKGIMDGGAGGMNPQVQQMQDAIKRQVMAENNRIFSNSGTVGGTAHQESFAKGMSDGMAQPLFAAYENDMNRKMQAGSALPGIDQTRINNLLGAGQIRDSYNQGRINADRQKFEETRTAPLKAWSEVYPMATDIGSRFGTQTGTQTNTSKTPMGQQILGGALMGLGVATGMPGLGGLFGGGGGAAAAAPWVMPSSPYASNSQFNLNSLFGGQR